MTLIDLLSAKYSLGTFFDNPVVEKFLYRGHSNASYKLTPGIHRKVTTSVGTKTISNNKYTAYSGGVSILQRFIQEVSTFVSNISDTDYLKWAMLAQHYGVPTRLLDWTTNPLVALYFACVDSSENDGAIWIIHSNNYNRFFHENWDKGENAKTIGEIAESLIREKEKNNLPQRPMLLNPYYIDQRMAMQSSRFMVWGTDSSDLDDMIKKEYYMEIPPEDKVWKEYGEKEEKQFAFCIRIRGLDKQSMIRQLEEIGISGKVLFPGLEGIGKFIERHYRFSYGETL